MQHSSEIFAKAIAEHIKVIQALYNDHSVLERIASKMSAAILRGNKILWCGNGGSAADSQHLAAELVGRFLRERRALPSIALTTNTSILSAIGNDYGYEVIFRRQVEALCVAGDVLGRHLHIGKQQERLPGPRESPGNWCLYSCLHRQERWRHVTRRRGYPADSLGRDATHSGRSHPLRPHALRLH
jgi:hypothetical protein